MPQTPIRIVVADENRLYRKTICSFLMRTPDIQVVGKAEDGLAAIQITEKHQPEVVLMSISMPVMNGIDAAWVITSKFPDVRVILLSEHDLEIMSEIACKAGAFCCLRKECSPKELLQAIMAANPSGGATID